jgi:hypothetical protein
VRSSFRRVSHAIEILGIERSLKRLAGPGPSDLTKRTIAYPWEGFSIFRKGIPTLNLRTFSKLRLLLLALLAFAIAAGCSS